MIRQSFAGAVALALALTSGALVRATEIIFDVTIGRQHQTSTGRALPESFVFELGVFEPGFNPTTGNMADWAGRWKPAARAAYFTQGRYYSGVASFTANVAPFTPGAAAYVWGMSGTEWILFRKSAWVWPLGSSVGAPAMTWTADASVTVVCGSVVPSGASFYYRSAAAAGALPPPLPWSEWCKLHFTTAQLSNAAISGPNVDADNDGQSNIMEYAAATWPEQMTSRRQPEITPSIAANPVAAQLSFKTDLRARLIVTGEVSSNLFAWDSTPSATVVTSVPGEYSVRDASPSGTFFRRYLRLRVAPQ